MCLQIRFSKNFSKMFFKVFQQQSETQKSGTTVIHLCKSVYTKANLYLSARKLLIFVYKPLNVSFLRI